MRNNRHTINEIPNTPRPQPPKTLRGSAPPTRAKSTRPAKSMRLGQTRGTDQARETSQIRETGLSTQHNPKSRNTYLNPQPSPRRSASTPLSKENTAKRALGGMYLRSSPLMLSEVTVQLAVTRFLTRIHNVRPCLRMEERWFK